MEKREWTESDGEGERVEGRRQRERERKKEREQERGGRKEIEEMNVELGVSIILLTGAKNSLP